jgi:hypothetical protein
VEAAKASPSTLSGDGCEEPVLLGVHCASAVDGPKADVAEKEAIEGGEAIWAGVASWTVCGDADPEEALPSDEVGAADGNADVSRTNLRTAR